MNHFPRDMVHQGKINRLASVETSSTHLNRTLVTRGCTTINYEAIKITFLMRRNRKQQSDQSTQLCQMHARSIVLTQTSTKYGIRRRLVAQLHTLPTYTSRSYDQGFHNALNGVSVPADKPRQQERYNYPFLDPSCQHTRTAPMCPTPHG